MVKKALGILATVLCVAGVAQAQTTTIVDQTYSTSDFLKGDVTETFTVSGPETLFIDGAVVTNSTIQGLGFLTGPGGFSDTLQLTNGSVLPNKVFNTVDLTTPGLYTFKFDFAGTTPGQVGIDVTVTPVPEPQTYAMLLAGLLVVGVTTRRRLFKSQPTPVAAF